MSLKSRPAPALISLALLIAGCGIFLLLREQNPVVPSSLDASQFEHFEVGGVPRAVTTTSDGVWVARADRSVIKLDPDTGTRVARGRLPFLPGQMVAAGGSVWVGAIEGTEIAALDPRTAEVTQQVEVGTTPQSLATDGEDLYVAAFDDGVVKRVDPTSGRVLEEVFADKDAFPSSLALGYDALWISDVVDDTVTNVQTPGRLRRVVVGDSPTRLVAGEEAVWVANFNGRSITRIEPDTEGSTSEILVGGKPGALATGAGYVWVLRPATDSFVLIDAAAGRWTGESYTVADAPQDIASGHGHFWIVSQPGTLTKVPAP